MKRKGVVQEFFAWWGIYIIVLIAVLLILNFTGKTHTSLSRDFLLSVDYAALGALMAVCHYYLLYTNFFQTKKYVTYLVLLVCLLGVFIMLDAVLVWIQTMGSMTYGGSFSDMFKGHLRHVLLVYVPITVVHTISHIYKDKK